MEQAHLEILLEDVRGKFDLVVEGHQVLRSEIQQSRAESKERDDHLLFLIQTLNGKIDGVDRKLDSKIDAVEQRLKEKIDATEQKLDGKIDAVEARLGCKINAVGADLAAHRLNTEAHPGVYSVREGES